MAGNDDVDVAFDRKWGPMRSEQRARYEFALAAACRQLHTAGVILRMAECYRAADDLAYIENALRSEVEQSLKGKYPMKSTLQWLGAGASSQSS